MVDPNSNPIQSVRECTCILWALRYEGAYLHQTNHMTNNGNYILDGENNFSPVTQMQYHFLVHNASHQLGSLVIMLN